MLYIEDTSACVIGMNNTGASGENWRLFTDTSGNFRINNQANGNLVTVGATGDATFAGAVTANNTITTIAPDTDHTSLQQKASSTTGAVRQLFENSDNSKNFEISGFFSSGSEQLAVQSKTNTVVRFFHGGSTTFEGNIIRKATPNGSVGGLAITDNGTGPLVSIGDTGTTLNTLYDFYNGNGIVGKIQTNGSGTAFVTSSDYRLKENVVTDWDATTRLKQLKPSRFNFIADADTTVDGFLAHEAQAVVPECVTGLKDAMMDEEYEVSAAVEATYDDDGNELTAAVEAVMATRSVPDYQGIDQSKLVPLLVKTIQELEARITTLEA